MHLYAASIQNIYLPVGTGDCDLVSSRGPNPCVVMGESNPAVDGLHIACEPASLVNL